MRERERDDGRIYIYIGGSADSQKESRKNAPKHRHYLSDNGRNTVYASAQDRMRHK